MSGAEFEQGRSKTTEIFLARELNPDKFFSKADRGFLEGRVRNGLLLISEKGNPTLVEFVQKNKKELRSQGLYITEANVGGSTLSPCAVIFDSVKKTVTIVNPGPEDEATWIEIGSNLHFKEFSERFEDTPAKIIHARRKVRASLKTSLY